MWSAELRSTDLISLISFSHRDGMLPERVVWCVLWNNVMDHNIVVCESEAACPLSVAVRQQLCISSLKNSQTPTVSPCRGNYCPLSPSYMCQIKSILQTYFFSFLLLTYHNRQLRRRHPFIVLSGQEPFKSVLWWSGICSPWLSAIVNEQWHSSTYFLNVSDITDWTSDLS